MNRRDLNFKALHLTQFTIGIGHSARTGTVRKAWEKADINKKWEQTTWAKKLATSARVCTAYALFCLSHFIYFFIEVYN